MTSGLKIGVGRKEEVGRLIKNGDFEQAVLFLSETIRGDANARWVWADLIKVSLIRFDLNAAYRYLESFKLALSSEPQRLSELSLKYHFLMAQVLVLDQQYLEGRKILGNLLNQHSDFVPGYIALATSFFKDREFHEAKRVIGRGLSVVGDDVDLVGMLALVELELGNLEKAEELERKLKTFKIESSIAEASQVQLLLRKGKHSEALKICIKSLNRDKTYIPMYVLKAVALEAIGKKDQAIHALEHALRVNPFQYHARFHLASMLTEKDPHRAVSLYDDVIRHVDSQNPIVGQSLVAKKNLFRTL